MSESEAVRKTEAIPQWKRNELDELVAFVEGHDSVGVVGIAGIPSRQLQSMRAGLHGQAAVRVSRNTLLRRALEEVAEGREALVDRIEGQVALVGTNANSFALYRELEASKTAAPISAGEVAPNDIVIPEGDTGVDPGPFVGELQQVGAEARIMEGSIKVTADSVVCDAGEEVSPTLEKVLGELGIEPKEVGLDLRAVFSEGVVFEPEDLDIDMDAYRGDLRTAAARGRSLSVGVGYPTAATTPALVARAVGSAKAVGIAAAVEDADLLPDLVRSADAQVRAIAARLDDDALPEELRGVPEPAGAGPESGDEAEATPDEDEGDADAQADEETEDESHDGDDDDDDGAAEGLGEMFG